MVTCLPTVGHDVRQLLSLCVCVMHGTVSHTYIHTYLKTDRDRWIQRYNFSYIHSERRGVKHKCRGAEVKESAWSRERERGGEERYHAITQSNIITGVNVWPATCRNPNELNNRKTTNIVCKEKRHLLTTIICSSLSTNTKQPSIEMSWSCLQTESCCVNPSRASHSDRTPIT